MNISIQSIKEFALKYLLLIGIIIGFLGLLAPESFNFIFEFSGLKTILFSVGCSVIATALISMISIERLFQIKNVIDDWGLISIYKTRQEMNNDCNIDHKDNKNILYISGFGMSSYINALKTLPKEEKLENKIKNGLILKE